MIFKRTFDLIVTLLTAPLWLTFLIGVAILVRVKLGSPVFFRQERPGLHGKTFELLKCRTMTNQRDLSSNLLPDADRLTPFGKWLRATSLDELPQLINVLRGEMSLVGPRPLLVEYLTRYTPAERRRHDVKPGITGWAQVRGRNALSWPEKFRLDIWYVDHWSVYLDLKILCLTLLRVLRREGISAAGEATMPEFRGA